MAYKIWHMEFIETPTFTRMLAELLTDDEYAGLQQVLVVNPEAGTSSKAAGASESCATPCLGVASAGE